MGSRQTQRLTAVAVNAKKNPGYYADGAGLYLQVSSTGSKSWIFRYTLAGRSREMGLGPLSTYSLAEARDQAKNYRQLLQTGIDPIEHRAAQRAKNLEAQAKRRTFEDCAREYHKLHASSWKNLKHSNQWINTLVTYAFPLIGSMDVSAIGKGDIIRVLEPIRTTKSETAYRVRQRIKSVLDWAAARDYRTDHDPHMWDQIATALPMSKDARKVEHFAACPYAEIHQTITAIRASAAHRNVKLATEFAILCASRSGEVRFAVWDEIDFEGKRWIIPAERMKAGNIHRVPLSDRALEILEILRSEANGCQWIFPNTKDGPFSDMVFTMLLRRLGFDFTMHGFRSTFRDWTAEQTAFPREVCELALAHGNEDKVEAAYFRSDLFEKRRQLMQAWATYCATERKPAEVIAIGIAKGGAS